MRLLIVIILAFAFCGCRTEDSCHLVPFTQEQVSKVRDSLGIISSTRFKRYDLTVIGPLTFIRYLSSVDVFKELDELKVSGYKGKMLITPFMLEPKISEGWLDEDSKKELLKLICSKQPAVPTMNRNAASLPEKLSTVGIEAMHLLYYAEGNESAYVSNRAFCPLEKQDSMVIEYLKKHN